MLSSKKSRIYCFDLLKIISIMIVFFHHIMMDLYIVHPMYNLKILEVLILRPNMNLGMIACGMFILISGATLALKGKEEEPISFYKKRFIRLLIPFYIAYIIYFIIRVINARSLLIFNDIPLYRFIFTICGVDEYLAANGIRTFSLGIGEWFLGCIMFCYVAYPFLFKFHKKYPIILFIIMTTFNIFINIFYGKFNLTIPSHMNFFCQIYNFYLGMILIDKNFLTKIKKWFLIFTVPIILFFYFYKTLLSMPDNFKTTIVLISLFITFYLLEKYIANIKYMPKIVDFFNGISLEIYLVHHFIIYQVDYMLGYRNLRGYEALTVILFDLIMTILVAIFVNKIDKFIRKTFLKN